MQSACLHTQINDMQCHIILQTDGYKTEKVYGQNMLYMVVQKKLVEMLVQNSLHLNLNIAEIVFYTHQGKNQSYNENY